MTPSHEVAAPKRRRWMLAALVLGALVIAVGAWLLFRANTRSVRAAASRLLACPSSQIEVLSSQSGDSGETYRVRACGKDAELVCAAPDYQCFVVPPGRSAR